MRNFRRTLFVFLFLSISYPLISLAQTSDKIRLFFDCGMCDESEFDYFRTEIRFVDFVRQREEADVHVLLTSQETGSGGVKVTVAFIGKGRFSGINDTLEYNAEPSETDDVSLKGLTQVMKLGLMRYVANSSASKDISITYTDHDTAASPSEESKESSKDPWKNWVFSISGNGYLSAEKTYKNHYFNGSISISRVTEALKFGFSASGSYERDRYDFGYRVLEGHSRSKSSSANCVFSLSDHWSARVAAGVSASTYSNQDLRISTSTAVEYNIFPYRVSTHKQLRLSYWLSAYHNDYHEETIYSKTQEYLFYQAAQATLEFTQPWGTAEVSAYASNYLHSIHRNSLQGWCDISLRVFKGLSVSFYTSAQRVRDQLSLPKGGASDEDILLRLQQIESSYYYYTSVGFTYTFGSLYNNIVNPRFGS